MKRLVQIRAPSVVQVIGFHSSSNNPCVCAWCDSKKLCTCSTAVFRCGKYIHSTTPSVIYICGIVLYKPMGTHTIWEARRYDIWMASSHGRHRNLSVIVSDPLQLQCERTAGSHRGRHRERSTSTTVPVLPQKIYAGGGSVHRLPGCPNCVFRVAVPGSGSHLRQLGNTAHFWRARTMCGNPHPWLIPQAALGSRRGAVSFSSSRFV